ncbi:MAG: hypothetical protein CMG60_04635 [Candidatus Marinimicrobia bacterium]|nr:hypothetical protein [Candidatus Neomarinimicrobiota bacterium]|tara:strand:- start:1854 stop:2036 length:183 start_codon:yes stop_codon:yes gene_type:complete
MKSKILDIFIALFIMLTIYNCEDDPLLAPQTETEEDGGSYGNLSLEGSISDGKDDNPELF